jgi:hypothetical protein
VSSTDTRANTKAFPVAEGDAPPARCTQCGQREDDHCDLDEPGVDHGPGCQKMHHTFKPARLAAPEGTEELCGALSGWGPREWYACLRAAGHDGPHKNKNGYEWGPGIHTSARPAEAAPEGTSPPGFAPDWSLLEATQASLREHMAMLKQADADRARLQAERDELKEAATFEGQQANAYHAKWEQAEADAAQLRAVLTEACGMLKVLDRKGEREAVTEFLDKVAALAPVSPPPEEETTGP